MSTSTQTSEVLAQMTNTAVEIFTLFADANQKVLRELVDLSAGAAKEGVRLYAELQSSAVEAVKDGQALLLRRQAEFQAAPADPAASYQQSLLESVENAQRVFRLFESNAQVVTRSAERLQVSAEQAAQEIQATCTRLSTRVTSLYSTLA
jgi:hypothetical protein